MKNKVCILIFILCFTLVFTSCSQAPIRNAKNDETKEINEVPKNGGKIGIATTIPVTFNPLQDKTIEEKSITGLVYEGLVKLDGQGKAQPCLAKSWEISKDNTEYVFNLREDVRWHDGKTFSSADVKATFDKIVELRRTKNSNDMSGNFPEFANIKSYCAPNPSTFIVSLNKADTQFLYKMSRGILPSDTKMDLSDKSVGTGIYKIINKNSETIQLKKNEDYYGKKPYIDTITIRIYPEEVSTKEAFKRKEVDIISVDPQDLGTFENQKDLKLIQYPSMYFEFIALNLTNSIFNDINVRKALCFGIDRDKILQDAVLGKGTIVEGPILPYSWAYNPNVQSVIYSPEKAKNILKDAGWEDTNDDGILEKSMQGKKRKLEFELLVNSSNTVRSQIASNVQKNLKEIGVSVKVVNLSWDELKNRVTNKKYDAAIMGWKLSENPDLSAMFSSNSIGNGLNFVSYSNPELDEILLNIQNCSSENTKKTLLFQAQQIISQDLPYIFLYSPNKLVVTDKRLKGFKPEPLNFFNNVANWWVE